MREKREVRGEGGEEKRSEWRRGGKVGRREMREEYRT